MNHEIYVENIKCGGCAGTITKKLELDERIQQVNIDVGSGLVQVTSETDAVDEWKKILLDLGYPEIGTAEGLAAAKAKAKSFISCATGRIDQALHKE